MSWTHLEDTNPKARKEHQCYLCERPIPRGTIHVARTGVNDDGICTFRMHTECEKITKPWSWEEWEYHDSCEFRLELIKVHETDTQGGGIGVG